MLAYNDSPLMMAKHVEHCLKLKNDYDSVKQKLSAGNLRLVVSIAKKYRNKGLSFLDLIQEGNAKLPHAAEKFDITRGFRFTTYASYWIKQSIKKALADTSREIRIPVHMIDTVNKVNKAIENLQMELRREPSNEEISKKTRLTISEVEAVKKYIRPPISINQKIGKNDSTLGDLLESYEAPSLRSVLPEDYENLKIAINEVLKTLPYRQREILRLLYGLGNNSDSLTLEEVGTIFKVTRERIRQLEAKAIRMLQQPSRSSQLVGFLS